MTCVKPFCGIGTINGCDPTCECGPDLCNLPNPYVVDADASEECHCKTVIHQLYVTGLSIKTQAVIPTCGETVVVAIAGLHSIIQGAYLWNPSYGHFKVVDFDYVTGQVTLENECQDDNASPGTVIPPCTLFLAVDKPCCDDSVSGSLYYPYLSVDFVVPAVGNCLDIRVTSIVGLTSGMEVQIGAGVYRISSIVSTDIINICNDGHGATSGTVVDAIDDAGVYVSPIIAVGVSLCGGSSEAQGALVICSNGNPTVLSGSTLGYIPVVIDATTHEVEYQDPASLWSIDPCEWDISDRVLHIDIDEYAGADSISLTTPGDSTQVTTLDILIKNTTCSDAQILLNIYGFTEGGAFDAASGEYASMSSDLLYGESIGDIDATVTPTLVSIKEVCEEVGFNRTDSGIAHDFRIEGTIVQTVPAGQEIRFRIRYSLEYTGGNVTDYTSDYMYVKVLGRMLAI